MVARHFTGGTGSAQLCHHAPTYRGQQAWGTRPAGQCSWRPGQPPPAISSDNIHEIRPLPSMLGFSKTSVTALWHLKTNTSVKLLGGRGRFHVDFGSFCTFPFPLNSPCDWDAASSLLEAWNVPDFKLAFVIKSLRKQSQGATAI